MAGHSWGGYGFYYSMASITAGCRGPCAGMAADDNRQASAPPFTHHPTDVRRQLSILCSANVAALLVCGGGQRRDRLAALRIAYSTSATIKAPQTRLQGGRQVVCHLTPLVCHALLPDGHHTQKGLGDEVFSQMVPAGGAASLLLLPTDNYQQLLLPASKLERLLGSRRHANEGALAYLHRCAWLSAFKGDAKHTAAADYYLCALLLERKLDLFAKEIVYYYPTEVAQSKLPRYFAQALILYQRTRTQPDVFYTDSNIEANYRDYTDMADSIPDRIVRTNMLRYSYGETYWWWYSYGGSHK